MPYGSAARKALTRLIKLCEPARSEENRRLYGKCVHLHGHNYVLEVVVSGSMDPASGYVMDLKQLSDLISGQIIDEVDHRNLNTDVPWLRDRVPTAENLAIAFWERLQPHLPGTTLRTVRVYETEKNWAECSADQLEQIHMQAHHGAFDPRPISA